MNEYGRDHKGSVCSQRVINKSQRFPFCHPNLLIIIKLNIICNQHHNTTHIRYISHIFSYVFNLSICCIFIQFMSKATSTHLFSELFLTSPFSIERGISLLQAHGGIACLMNGLGVDHRKGREYANYCQMKHINHQVAVNEKDVKKDSDIVENIMLYFVTLEFAIKLLFLEHGIAQIYSENGEYTAVSILLYFLPSLMSFCLLFLLKRVTHHTTLKRHFLSHTILAPVYPSVRVRRSGQILMIGMEDVEIGDILIYGKNEVIWIDGIVMSVKNAAVNEEETVSGRDQCIKHDVWQLEQSYQGYQHPTIDPFVLSGSHLLRGTLQLLVCILPPSTSFHNLPHASPQKETATPSIIRMKMLASNIFQVAEYLIFFIASVLTVICIAGDILGFDITFIDYLGFYYSLLTYLQFVGKDDSIHALTHFLSAHCISPHYTLHTPSALERLSSITLLVIEEKSLYKITSNRSDYMGCLKQLGELNSVMDIKIIVSEEDSPKIYEHYGETIDQEYILKQGNGCMSAKDRLQRTMKAIFIQNNVQDFIQNMMPILIELEYDICYLRARRGTPLPLSILSILCNRIDPYQDDPSHTFLLPEQIHNESLHIRSSFKSEDVILQLLHQSWAYCRMYNIYMCIIVNNTIELSMLIGMIALGVIVNGNMAVAILLVTKLAGGNIYSRMGSQIGCISNSSPCRMSWRPVLKINGILSLYYLYMLHECLSSKEEFPQFRLFMLLLSNRMFRFELLLADTTPKVQLMRNLLKLMMVVLVIQIGGHILLYGLEAREMVVQTIDIIMMPVLIVFLQYMSV